MRPFQPIPPAATGMPPAPAEWLEKHGRALSQHERDLASAILVSSPFLAQLLHQFPDDIQPILAGKNDKIEDEVTALLNAVHLASNRAEAASLLRQARKRFILQNALCDISGQWPIMQAAARMSSFADACVARASAFLLREAHGRGELALPTPDEAPERGSGLVILGMGKFGAQELNFSSDIDLIVLFDKATVPYTGRHDPHHFFVRLTRDLVKLLQERTGDGYVFRVDLRLRPDAAMTPLAISMEAATAYYESTGETWERSAMIKARPVGGDLALGSAFLKAIRPFIWRRHLDFAALDDVMNTTRQIRKARTEAQNPPAGLNVKLGRGGIREVEFFVQAQQMIGGGRNPRLRHPGTLAALNALTDEGLVAEETCDALQKAYLFLRQVEHRLQMVNDEQTQTLPLAEDALTRLCLFMGFANIAAFADAIDTHRAKVRAAFDEFFHRAGLAGEDNSENPGGETVLEQARRLGFEDADAVAAMVDRWQSGSYRAFRSERSRTLARDMTSTVLAAFAPPDGGDDALRRFDGFLSHLPAGVQLFALLRAHDWLLEQLRDVLATAPGLGLMLERKPALLDVLLDDQADQRVSDMGHARADLDFLIEPSRSYEETLDIARRWVSDHRFLIGVRQISGRMSAAEAGRALANIIEAAMASLKPIVETEFHSQHGTLPGGAFGIVALGKLASHDMTATSDADLVFVYDCAPDSVQSDGAKPLAPSTYFQRLGQRMVTALSALTAEGRIVEVDMRMRPQGAKGPLCTRLVTLQEYFAEGGAGWLYEHQAMLRTRIVSAPEPLADEIRAVLHSIRTRQRQAGQTFAQILHMRQRMADHFKPRSMWSIKQARGGLVDLEFIVQGLALVHGAEADIPITDLVAALRVCARHGWLTDDEHQTLLAAHRLYSELQSLQRLCLTETFNPDTAPAAFIKLMLTATGASSLDVLQHTLHNSQTQVKALFDKIIAAPHDAAAVETPDLSFE